MGIKKFSIIALSLLFFQVVLSGAGSGFQSCMNAARVEISAKDYGMALKKLDDAMRYAAEARQKYSVYIAKYGVLMAMKNYSSALAQMDAASLLAVPGNDVKMQILMNKLNALIPLEKHKELLELIAKVNMSEAGDKADDIYIIECQTYGKIQNYEKLLETALKFCASEPTASPGYYKGKQYQLSALTAMGNYEKALTVYSENDVESMEKEARQSYYYSMINICRSAKKYEDSLIYFTKILSIKLLSNADKNTCLYEMASMFRTMGRDEDAAKICRQIFLSLAQNRKEDAAEMLYQICLKSGDQEGMESAIKSQLEYSKMGSMPYFRAKNEQISYLISAKKFSEAGKVYSSADFDLMSSLQRFTFCNKLSEICRIQGNYDDLTAFIQKYSIEDNDSSSSGTARLFSLAFKMKQDGNDECALAIADMVINSKDISKRETALELKYNIYKKLKDYEKMIGAAQEMAKAASPLSASYYKAKAYQFSHWVSKKDAASAAAVYSQQDLNEAENTLKRSYYNNMAELYRQNGDYKAFTSAMENLAGLSGENEEAKKQVFCTLAKTLADAGHIKEAIESCDKIAAIPGTPHKEDIYELRYNICRQAGLDKEMIESAAEMSDSALSGSPAFEKAVGYQVAYWVKNKNIQKLEELYSHDVSNLSEQGKLEFLKKLYSLQCENKNCEGAAASAEKIAELKSQSPGRVFLDLAKFFDSVSRSEDAAKICDRIIDAPSWDCKVEAAEFKYQTASKLKRTDDMLNAAEKMSVLAAAGSSAFYRARNYQAAGWASKGNYEKACSVYSQAELDTMNPEIKSGYYKRLGEVYYGLGSYKTAAECYERAGDASPALLTAVQEWFRAADLYGSVNKPEKSIELYEKIFSNEKISSDKRIKAVESKAALLASIGRGDEAIASISKIKSIPCSSKLPWGYAHVFKSKVLTEQGKKNEADAEIAEAESIFDELINSPASSKTEREQALNAITELW